MRVLVAGGSGLIGTAVVHALRTTGHDVVAASRSRGNLPPEIAHVAVDLGRTAPAPTSTGPLDAVVNLVGIAVERGTNTFQAAHVDAVEHLLAYATELGVRRFVHISVVRIESAKGAYHATKRAGEERVIHSDQQWTVLRPGLVYGPSDAMLTGLVRLIRATPLCPIPRGAQGILQPVDVVDVAGAIVAALDEPKSAGRTFDIVGPERLTLSALIARVSEGLELRTVTVPIPLAAMRLGAWLVQSVCAKPLVTPTQLGMLADGLYGDGKDARGVLGLGPRPLKDARIRALAAEVPGPSLRLLPSAGARRAATSWSTPLWFPWLAITVGLIGPWVVHDVWLRMLGINLALVALLVRAGAPLRAWTRRASRASEALRHVGVGLASGACMVAAAVAVISGLRFAAPEFMRSTEVLYAWTSQWPIGLRAAMLVIIASCEDLVWRFAIALGLVRRCGPLGAVLVGAGMFTLAHATTGPPVLWLAALLAGAAWNVLAIRTRSWVTVATCHLVFDSTLMWLEV